MKRLQNKDSTGERIKVGDRLRIVGVPDLAWMAPKYRAESLPVFQYLVGKYKRVEEFDQFGFAWLRFKIRKGPHVGYHSVAMEPYLLKVVPGTK